MIHKATSILMTFVGDNFGCFSHQQYLEVLASRTIISTNNLGDNLFFFMSTKTIELFKMSKVVRSYENLKILRIEAS